jgi:hypothetical protein
MKKLMMITIGLFLAGCVSVPPKVAQLHQKEQEVIQELQKSHLALAEAYIDQKLVAFETFYFQQYAPAYRQNWMESFKQKAGRDYDPAQDFSRFYEDLTAEYLEVVEPLNQMRADLKAAIETEYGNALAANEAVGNWLEGLQKLTDAQRAVVDSILSAAKPGMSLDAIDSGFNAAKEAAKEQMGLR